ncbi:Uncharacterised protein g8380 [Pycnogonum litorale]
MTLLELFLLKNRYIHDKFVTQVTNTIALMESYIFWKQHENIFWKWMESVVDLYRQDLKNGVVASSKFGNRNQSTECPSESCYSDISITIADGKYANGAKLLRELESKISKLENVLKEKQNEFSSVLKEFLRTKNICIVGVNSSFKYASS